MLYLWIGDPKAMVIFGGFFQAATLPVIAQPALYRAIVAWTHAWRHRAGPTFACGWPLLQSASWRSTPSVIGCCTTPGR